jgi:hypothetical protein
VGKDEEEKREEERREPDDYMGTAGDGRVREGRWRP